MNKTRLEAFSDGVIIITTMVLELKAPQGTQLSDLLPLRPVFLGYALAAHLALLKLQWISGFLVAAVACIGFIPDRRIEKKLA